MNLRDQVISRCMYAACARPLPRRVNFCPYCGTAQTGRLAQPMPVASLPEPGFAAPPAVRVEPAVAPVVTAAAAPPSPSQRTLAGPKTAARAAPQAAQPRPAKLRYWIIVLLALWLVWLYGRPSSGKIEARVEHALALVAQCHIGAANRELTALRTGKAREAHLQRVQAAIDEAALSCKKAQAESARTLLVDAERALTLGNYKAAADKMEVCLAMQGAGNRQCTALKARADKLDTRMQRCLAAKRDWNGGRCL